jgi:hypothetical protein
LAIVLLVFTASDYSIGNIQCVNQMA